MLEYVKMILQKVSFDLSLFEKELQKSLSKYLNTEEEIASLKSWCYLHYSSPEFSLLLDKCFSSAR